MRGGKGNKSARRGTQSPKEARDQGARQREGRNKSDSSAGQAVDVSARQPPLSGGLTDVAMAMALAFRAASSRPGSVSLTSAAAAPHHGGGPLLRRLSRGLRRGWRRRKKTHETPQMGGSLAGQEEERGGPGRRCGTSSKGARSAPSPRPPGGCRVDQAPGAACPRPRGHPGSARTQSSLPVPGRARRRELGLRSTPLRAAQDGPEGREKPPGRSGWTSEFRGQASPPGCRAGERCSRG